MPTSSWVTIDSIVAGYLIKSEQSDNRRYKCWQLAFSGSEELGLDFFYRVNSVKLPVLANYTVQLPLDYINYTKVGVLNSLGEIIPLKYNNKLTTYADLMPDRISKTQDNSIPNIYLFNTPIWYNYWNNGAYTNLYGLPSGAPFVGDFKIDNAGGVILLGENFGYPYIMLEYVAAPQQNGTYYIPFVFKKALESYIAWQDIALIPPSSHFGLGHVRDREHTYFRERRLAYARYKPIRISEAYQANIEAQRLTVKM